MVVVAATAVAESPETVEQARRRREIEQRVLKNEEVDVEGIDAAFETPRGTDLHLSSGLTLQRTVVDGVFERRGCPLGALVAAEGWQLARLEAEQYEKTFAEGDPKGWQRLRRGFPEMQCLVQFSVPEFIPDSGIALVSYLADARSNSRHKGLCGFRATRWAMAGRVARERMGLLSRLDWLVAVLALALVAGCETSRDRDSAVSSTSRAESDDSQGSDSISDPSRVEPVTSDQSEPHPESVAPESVNGPADAAAQPSSLDEGLFQVGGDIERPRRLGDSRPIEGLMDMMRSGDYVWGACIFTVTISETGEVGDVEFLKPVDLAQEVQEVIRKGVEKWRFSPATRDGQPVPVYYNLVIHHCPYRKKIGSEIDGGS